MSETLAYECLALGSTSAARLDTAKLARDSLERAPKAVVLRCKDSLLPVAGAAAADADAAIREAAQGILVVFAVKSGSMAILDKARRGTLQGRLEEKSGWSPRELAVAMQVAAMRRSGGEHCCS